MRSFWAVAIGAAAGGVSRYYLSYAIQSRAGAGVPGGTLVVNVTGSFLAGFVLAYTQRNGHDDIVRIALVTGFCGAYTTFSAFAVETLRLAEQQGAGAAALNVAANLVIGLVAAGAGIALGRAY